MRTVTSEDIAKLEKKIEQLENKMDAKYDKIIWRLLIITMFISITLQIFFKTHAH